MSVERKKILVFADWFLPGFKAGGPIRSVANLVAALPEFDFFIVTRNTDHHSTHPYPDIETGKWNVHLPNVQVMYLEEKKITRRAVDEIIGSQLFDWYYLNSLFSKRFTLLPLRLLRRRKLYDKIILAPRGMLHSGALGVKAGKKKIFLALAKTLGWYNSIVWHATGETEQDEIRAHFGKDVRIILAPNLALSPLLKILGPKKISGEMRLISVARISPEKGIKESLVFLKSAQLQGAITVNYFGTEQNASYLEECRVIAAGIEGCAISFHGEIHPTEIPSALSSHHFFYSATWGENFGHAIVDALAYGVPVLISDRTPWRKLEEKQAGWDLPLDREPFASQLKKCLDMGNEKYHQFCSGAATLGKEITNDEKSIEASRALFS
ncbi:MAG: glycosyltransferase [Flavobacteriales bacterium]|nr:glycosyltransferase [Flavobacteriales bacterium]